MFTLENLDTPKGHIEGKSLHITDASGELAYADEKKQKPVKIHFLGPKSREGKAATLQFLKGYNKAQEFKDNEEDKSLETLDAINDAICNRIAAVATGWENIKDSNGDVEFSKEAIYNACMRSDALMDQCYSFIKDEEAFIQA